MSTIINEVLTDFKVQGTQALVTGLRQAGEQTGTFFNRLSDTSRMSDRIGKQWSAIATTIRYAVAGRAVFGLVQMVSQLKDVQVQLGLIQAVGSKPGPGGREIPLTNVDVTKLGQQMQQVSQATLTPIDQINDAVINLYSTVQNLKTTDIPNILTSIGQAAELSQTPIESLTQAATTMNIAFGRPNNAQTIAQFSRQWWGLIKEAPGGVLAAPEIAQQLPNISTIFQQGLSPNVPAKTAQAQMMTLVLGSLRFGATPSTGMRGLQYLLQSLETAPSNKARAALASVGVTPFSVRRKGIYATTIGFLQRIAGITGHISPENIAKMQAIPEDQLETTQNLPGVSPGEMTFLRTAVGRVHAVRAAIVLASQLQHKGNVKSLSESLQLMLDEQNNQADDVDSMSKAWQAFAERTPLKAATIAINNMRLQAAQALEPIINWSVRHTVLPLGNVMQQHRHATNLAVEGITGGAAALGLWSFLTGGRGGLLRAGRIGSRGFAGTQAIESIASGTPPKGTILDPIFVRVVGSAFGTNIPPIIRPSERTPPKEEDRLGKTVARGGISRFFGVVGAAAFATQLISDYAPKSLGLRGHGPFDKGFWDFSAPWEHGNAAQQNARFKELAEIQRKLGSQANMVTSITEAGVTGKGGKAELTLNINLKHPDGTTETKKIRVHYNQYINGNFPSSKGAPNARK